MKVDIKAERFWCSVYTAAISASASSKRSLALADQALADYLAKWRTAGPDAELQRKLDRDILGIGQGAASPISDPAMLTGYPTVVGEGDQ